MTVMESTGGSTGSSLAFVCAVKGYRLQVVSSDAFAREKLQTIRVFGAELLLLPSQGGQTTPDLVPRMREEARKLAASENAYWTNQFFNADAFKGYETLGQELLEQAQGPISAFCGGVGTAGMLIGVSRAFRQANRTTRIVALEPASSAILSTGVAGAHQAEGIGIGMIPPLLDKDAYKDAYDEARGIDEAEARQMARRLAREEGIFVGTSSGLNVVGALQLARELGPGHTVATVAVDTGLKYLAGDLYEG